MTLPASLISLSSGNRTSVRLPVEQRIQSRKANGVLPGSCYCTVGGSFDAESTISGVMQSVAPGSVFGSFLLKQTQTALSVQAAHNGMFVE